MPLATTFVAADGDGYEQLMGRWSRRLARPFLDFVGTADGESVLDVGCGTGCLTFELLDRCNPRQVQGDRLRRGLCRTRPGSQPQSGVKFDVGDACALVLPDRSYDRVLSLLMLHFVPRAERGNRRNATRRPAGRCGRRGRVGRPRRFRRHPNVLRHCGRAGSESG